MAGCTGHGGRVRGERGFVICHYRVHTCIVTQISGTKRSREAIDRTEMILAARNACEETAVEYEGLPPPQMCCVVAGCAGRGGVVRGE